MTENANSDTEKCLTEFQARNLENRLTLIMAKAARKIAVCGLALSSLILTTGAWAQDSGDQPLPAWLKLEQGSTTQDIESSEISGPQVGLSLQRNDGMWLNDSRDAITEGFWRPIDSVALRAGYGQGLRSSLDANALSWVSTSNCGANAGNPDEQCLWLQRVNGANAAGANEIETYVVGASWDLNERFSLSLDYFRTAVENHGSLADTAPMPMSKFVTGADSLKSLPGLPGRERGVEVSMALDANFLGQLELGVQLAKIRQANEQLTADPLTRAVLDLGWSKGDFTGSLVSRHLSNARGAGELEDSWTTLDVKFAWRTPWNASLSVGAKNVLDTETGSVSSLEDAALDAGIDGVFGRVPYFRYEQDL